MDKEYYEKIRDLDEQQKEKLKLLFDESAKVIISLSEEKENLRIRFGEESKLFKTKEHQCQILSNLYSVTSKTINDQNHIMRLMTLSQRVLESLVMQHELLLKWEKIQFTHGIDSEKARIADEALTNCMVVFSNLLNDEA